jgi:hypothetical protein
LTPIYETIRREFDHGPEEETQVPVSEYAHARVSICRLTFALNGVSKRAQPRLRASVFERVVRAHRLYVVHTG